MCKYTSFFAMIDDTTVSLPLSISSPLLKEYKNLTDIREITECLNLLEEEEDRIDADLDVLLDKRDALEADLDCLDVLRPRLGNLKIDNERMVAIIRDTSHLAERISDKVRQLDLEQSRVRESIQVVEKVQELKTCIQSIHQSLGTHDYETAAEHIHRASHIDKKVVEGEFAEMVVPTSEYPDAPPSALATSKSHLYVIFSQHFDKAVSEHDEANLTRFFKLFPLIGYEKEGLDRYSSFVAEIVGVKAREGLRNFNSKNPIFFADSINTIYENVALIINQHTPMVEVHYGPGKMLRVMQRLEEECDLQAGIVLDRLWDERNVNRMASEVQTINSFLTRRALTSAPPSIKSHHTSQQSQSQNLNPLFEEATILRTQLDSTLTELALLSQRTHLYTNFMHARARQEMEILCDLGEGQVEAVLWADKREGERKKYDAEGESATGLLRRSGIARRVSDEVVGAITLLEEFLVRGAIDQAMKMDEYNPVNTQTSTSVDDVFFIVKKSLRRIISTSDVDCLEQVIASVAKIFETDYLRAFERKIGPLRDSVGRNTGLVDGLDGKVLYMMILNNYDVTTDYLKKLVEELVDDISALDTMSNSEQQRGKDIVNSLSSVGAKAQKFLQADTETLFTQALKPRVRPLFQGSYKDIKYVLDENEYAEQEGMDEFVTRFKMEVKVIIDLYQKVLTENNWQKLMGLIIDSIAKQWERIVLQTKFNQLGALQFDKDLRSLNQYLSSLSDWPVRDKFTRLMQMRDLLSFESPIEIYDCWGSKAGSITWRLTVAEVKKVLGLRTDFRPEDVAGLKL